MDQDKLTLQDKLDILFYFKKNDNIHIKYNHGFIYIEIDNNLIELYLKNKIA